MIRLKANTRVKLMTINAFVLFALGLGLFYIRATMTTVLFYVFGEIFALALVAAALLLIAGVEWLCSAGLVHQLGWVRGLLFLSTTAAVCSVFLLLYPGSSIRMLCYVLAVYALSLSLGKLGFARSWKGTKREQVVMYILGGVGLTFSGALVAFAGQDDRDALAVIATYSLFMGFQMLLTMYFLLQKRALEPVEPPSPLTQASRSAGS